MVDRMLNTPPPAEGYRQVGLWCVYHDCPPGPMCRSPLDCDIAPMWVLTREAFASERKAQRTGIHQTVPCERTVNDPWKS